MSRLFPYIAILVLLLVACAGYLLLSRKQPVPVPAAPAGVFADFANVSSSTPSSVAASTSAPAQLPANAKVYTSAAYHFSLYYPDDLTVTEHPISGGSMVIIFQDAASGQGFEIFVTPYDQPKITQQRFAMDEPSGVMNEPENITIDGAPATEFLSSNDAMGASREIWFLHSGYLFEVTAPQSLDTWFQNIMETWKFA